MRHMFVVCFIAIVLLPGCASIQYNERIVQPVYSQLKTKIGGVVLRVERTSDLPNIFGKADIWGGKTDKGFIELRYQGMTQEGKLIFNYTNIKYHSNETTISRYFIGQPTVSTTVIISQIRSSTKE